MNPYIRYQLPGIYKSLPLELPMYYWIYLISIQDVLENPLVPVTLLDFLNPYISYHCMT